MKGWTDATCGSDLDFVLDIGVGRCQTIKPAWAYIGSDIIVTKFKILAGSWIESLVNWQYVLFKKNLSSFLWYNETFGLYKAGQSVTLCTC